MQQIETGLRDSINYYTRILALLQNIDGRVGTASQDELTEMNESLKELQAPATQRDQWLLEHLQKVPLKSEFLSSLLEKRDTLVKEVLRLNGRLTAKAMGVKSLLAHEIKTLRNGLSAIKGYSHHENYQGRIVNRSS
ncbi:MAG: hypothetical protein V2B20_04740 [Pseudomonadota bacterium]